MPLPLNPPKRDRMSDAEKTLRDKLIRRWTERNEVYHDYIDTGISGQRASWTFWGHRQGQDKWCYTTKRMFDGKFWSFRYRWSASRRAYVLVRSSLRRHAKRKDAKQRSHDAAPASR